ncbi:MAG: thermonuclease family protein [bacterium]
MKKRSYFSTIILILLAAGMLAGALFVSQERGLPQGGFEMGKQADPESIAGRHAFISRVIDGDTIEVEIGDPSTSSGRDPSTSSGYRDRIRYIGIEAPELVHPERPVECFAREAAARNRELVEGKAVRLERDISDRDKYGRLLRYVWVDDAMVNLKLVEEGYASAVTFPPDVKYADLFLNAERRAREAKRGLWERCGN